MNVIGQQTDVIDLVRAACAGSIVGVDDTLIGRAIDLAEEHGLSVCDAAYVAAAELNGWTLVSTDDRDLVRPGHAIAPDTAAA